MSHLTEHGYLRGKKRIDVTAKSNAEGDLKPRQTVILMDLIIETISKCSDEADDGVQLQVINSSN